MFVQIFSIAAIKSRVDSSGILHNWLICSECNIIQYERNRCCNLHCYKKKTWHHFQVVSTNSSLKDLPIFLFHLCVLLLCDNFPFGSKYLDELVILIYTIVKSRITSSWSKGQNFSLTRHFLIHILSLSLNGEFGGEIADPSEEKKSIKSNPVKAQKTRRH